jgi:RNA polymerase sigma-70 factor, ECF subfamily
MVVGTLLMPDATWDAQAVFDAPGSMAYTPHVGEGSASTAVFFPRSPMFKRLRGLRWASTNERAQPVGNGATAAGADETRLVEALRAGDEAAFAALVTMYYPAMLRVALMYVSSRAVAEDVIQETWLGVLQGIGRFEGRSSLKTWIFRILANTAKTRALREGRSIPFSSLADFAADEGEPTVDPDRFFPTDDPNQPHHWASPPRSWEGMPEERLLSRETAERIEAAIQALPPAQRAVITLRDVEGWTPEEVCDQLGVSDGNQRVLLHRARGKVRQALESYLSEG